MEYKINNIDTNLRQKIKDITSEGLVHNKTDIELDKDEKQGRKPKEHALPKANLKDGKDEINVDAFKEEKIDKLKGSFLDVRK